MRLVGGSNSTGRLEVFHNGVWGTVCSDFFTAAEARVVCKMLGFVSGAKTDNNNNNNNIHICIAPYGRNFRGARPGSVLVGVRRGKRVSLGEEKCL